MEGFGVGLSILQLRHPLCFLPLLPLPPLQNPKKKVVHGQRNKIMSGVKAPAIYLPESGANIGFTYPAQALGIFFRNGKEHRIFSGGSRFDSHLLLPPADAIGHGWVKKRRRYLVVLTPMQATVMRPVSVLGRTLSKRRRLSTD